MRLSARLRPSPLARLTLSVAVGALLLWLVGITSVARVLTAADGRLVAAALAVALADRALMIGKWYPLLRARVPGVSLAHAARVYLAAGLTGYMIPVAGGADVVRVVVLGRRHAASASVGASVAIERLLGLLGSTLFALLAVVLAFHRVPALRPLLPWTIGMTALAICALPLALSGSGARSATRWLRPAWAARVNRFLGALSAYRDHPRLLISVGLLSILEQTLPIIVLWLLSAAVHAAVGIDVLLVVIPLTTLLSRLPISLNGIGVGEGILVFALGLFGVAASQALALALAARVIEVAALAPGALALGDLAALGPAGAILPEAPCA